MKRKYKRLLVPVLSSLLFCLIGFGSAYYIFGIKERDELDKAYAKELDKYKTEFNSRCYVLARDVEEGDTVSEQDFELQNIPQTIKSETIVNDLSSLIGATYSRSVKKHSIVYQDMFFNLKDIPKDLRLYELSAIFLPLGIQEGEYIDVRIKFPSGLDYVVLAKKRVQTLSSKDENTNTLDIISLHLNSEEILRLSSALVDAYLTEDALLYTTTYISPDNQDAAEITYPSNDAVQALITQDPNVVRLAAIELEKSRRDMLNSSLSGFEKAEKIRQLIGSDTDKPNYKTFTAPDNKGKVPEKGENKGNDTEKADEIRLSDSKSID